MIITTDIPAVLLQLSKEYEPPARKIVMDSSIPDVESLTPKQLEVYETLLLFLQGKLPDIDMVALQGFAGTGKTYVITQVLKWYVRILQREIAITAPTNKAVKVLRQTANFMHYLISYVTVHKLLGLKEKIDDRTGMQTFEQEFGLESAIQRLDALGIDETSMLNDDLFMLIRKEFENSNNRLKVIFLGDPVQIPPINKNDCIPFNPGKTGEYKIMTLRLEEIIRQKEGNPIIELATLTREHYRNADIPYERKTVMNANGSVVIINSSDKDQLYNLCDIYFSNKRFKINTDFIKVIAWTNKTVDFMNNKVRSFIYKEEYAAAAELVKDKPLAKPRMAKIIPGEKLIANSPIVDNIGYKQIIIFNTNDEFEVVKFTIEDEELFQGVTVKCYNTTVEYEDPITMKLKQRPIVILHEDSEYVFKKTLDSLIDYAKKQPVSIRGQAWRNYFRMKNKFADVKYAYAITAHKAQGSTYDNAIVIVADMDKNKKIEERNRIKYVAFTRARYNLFIVE